LKRFFHQKFEPSPAVWARKQPPGVAGWRLGHKDRCRLCWKKYLKETAVVNRILYVSSDEEADRGSEDRYGEDAIG
jgi:hypothetical protein